MITISRIAQASLAAIALALASATALAQSNAPVQEVEVTAFRPMIITLQDKAGRQVDIIRLSRVVSYSDLDLATSTGAEALRKRVRRAAMGICVELKQEYPNTTQYGSCYKEAVDSGMPQVDAVVAAAQEMKNRSAQPPP
ncbi:MAG TPA: UrcA family protein [Steroidobacteraceae bacterium]|nr:UrcA family protein [Steroidobacteraceae bacterium]